MFTPMLLSLAAVAGAQASEPIVVVEDAPTIRLSLAGYDLANDAGVLQLKRDIRKAANRVCVRERGIEIHLVTVACVKSAVAGGNRQLDQLVARRGFGSPLVASIAVTASAN